MLGAIIDPVAHQEDVQQREIHATKTERDANQSVVIAAFQTRDPPAYAGPKGVADQRYHFNALRTYAQWDAGDGQSGTWNRIDGELEYRTQFYEHLIEQTLEGFPELQSVLLWFLTNTVEFLHKKARAMTQLYRRLCTDAFGTESPSADAKEMCWSIVTTLLRVLFEEL